MISVSMVNMWVCQVYNDSYPSCTIPIIDLIQDFAFQYTWTIGFICFLFQTINLYLSECRYIFIYASSITFNLYGSNKGHRRNDHQLKLALGPTFFKETKQVMYLITSAQNSFSCILASFNPLHSETLVAFIKACFGCIFLTCGFWDSLISESHIHTEAVSNILQRI